MKKTMWKWLILITLTIWSLALVTPVKDKVKLGLDLEGGTSFTVEIDRAQIRKQLTDSGDEYTEETLQEKVKETAAKAKEQALEVIRNRVDGLGIAEPIIYATTHKDEQRIVVQLPGVDDVKRQEARDAILSVAFLEFRLVHKDSTQWVQALFTGDKEPEGYTISEEGNAYVRDKDAVQNKEMDQDFLARQRRFEYKPGCEFFLERDEEEQTGRIIYRPFYVEVRRQLTGDAIKNAQIEYHPVTRRPSVSLRLDGAGAKKFAQVTRDNAPRGPKNIDQDVGRQLAIILDGTLYSAPVINTEIPNGRAEITGRFTVQQAMRLSTVLRAGSLPAPVKIVETRTVDPSLGDASIKSGVRALSYGAGAIVVFMLLYYMLAGFVANLTLLLDLLILPLGMMVAAGFLGLATGAVGGAGGGGLPTLTLPGIAGIVLTIGMAVDANVLIFERIREEQKSGKRFASAVSAGYEKVFSTIFDANVTTLLTAVILFWQGSGPIRGFAVTLSAGIIVSMYMSLSVSRLFFDTLAQHTSIQKLKMLTLVSNTKIDFLGKRFIAAVISVLIIASTWYMFFQRGQDNFGVDFTGGAAITFDFNEKVGTDKIRAELEGAGVKSPFIQYHREMDPDQTGELKEYLEIKVAYEDGDMAEKTLIANENFKVRQTDSVGPQVGVELRKKGLWAILAALIGIVIYISFRFEFAFAMGAITALVHDVLITVGIYCLFGRQLSLPVIAALLTIVGYSVNDTIVVFDRIREDLKLIRNQSYKDIANLSINQTLSRTLLTSITTLMTVVMLLIFGGGAINDFALTLFIGILVGTYSSIFVATPIMLLWHREEQPAES